MIKIISVVTLFFVLHNPIANAVASNNELFIPEVYQQELLNQLELSIQNPKKFKKNILKALKFVGINSLKGINHLELGSNIIMNTVQFPIHYGKYLGKVIVGGKQEFDTIHKTLEWVTPSYINIFITLITLGFHTDESGKKRLSFTPLLSDSAKRSISVIAKSSIDYLFSNINSATFKSYSSAVGNGLTSEFVDPIRNGVNGSARQIATGSAYITYATIAVASLYIALETSCAISMKSKKRMELRNDFGKSIYKNCIRAQRQNLAFLKASNKVANFTGQPLHSVYIWIKNLFTKAKKIEKTLEKGNSISEDTADLSNDKYSYIN